MGENNRGKTFITKMVFHGVESISKILIQLVDADNELTMEVAGLIYSDRMFVDHFGNLAHKMHVQHTRGLGLPPPLLVLPE